MNEVKICPNCSAKNPIEIKKCQLCGHVLDEQQKENTDWLNMFRGSEPDDGLSLNNPFQTDNQPQDESTVPEGDTPDWLSNLRDKKDTEDIFNSFQTNQAEQTNLDPFGNSTDKNQKEISNNQEVLPDWLNMMRNDSNEPESKNEDDQQLPDWLSSQSLNQPEQEQWFENKTNQNNDQEENLPDWLSTLSQNNNEEQDFSKPEEIMDSEQPDWLKNSIDEQQDDFSLPQPTESAPFSDLQSEQFADDDLPDWLNQTTHENQSEQPASPLDGEPDWLSEINAISEPNPEESKQQKEVFEKDDLFSSIEEFNFSEEDQPDQTPIQEETSQPLKSPFLDDLNLDDLDFAFSEDESAEEENNEESISQSQPAFFEEDIKESELINHPISKKAQPFTLEDMPDWLEDIDKTQTSDQENKSSDAEKAPQGNIQEGNLPSWLKAMRPIGAVLPSEIRKEDKKSIEKSGPLAGLQGVLSSESIISHYSTPPTYASKIDITEKNRLHANLLEEVFAQDKLRKPKVQNKSQLDYTITRILIPLLLIIAIVFTYFNAQAQTTEINISRDYPAVQFASIANSLTSTIGADPNILVIFTGDAASIGETQIVSQKAMESFFYQNSWITILASNPTGLLVADQLTAEANQTVPTYNIQERLTTLGYLPNNDSNIQGFISNPRLLSPTNPSGSSIWETPALSNITKMDDFDLIWIITDNAEYSQKWIEQLQSTQFSKPILVSASKQAAPILNTYLDSGQIDGIVSGLQGAATYEQVSFGGNGSYQLIWKEYQTGILLFLMFIFSGIIIQIIKSIFKSNS